MPFTIMSADFHFSVWGPTHCHVHECSSMWMWKAKECHRQAFECRGLLIRWHHAGTQTSLRKVKARVTESKQPPVELCSGSRWQDAHQAINQALLVTKLCLVQGVRVTQLEWVHSIEAIQHRLHHATP
jgi:hypothetical protein